MVVASVYGERLPSSAKCWEKGIWEALDVLYCQQINREILLNILPHCTSASACNSDILTDTGIYMSKKYISDPFNQCLLNITFVIKYVAIRISRHVLTYWAISNWAVRVCSVYVNCHISKCSKQSCEFSVIGCYHIWILNSHDKPHLFEIKFPFWGFYSWFWKIWDDN